MKHLFIAALFFLVALEPCRAHSEEINGWLLAGSAPQDYQIGIDDKVKKDGMGSGYIFSKKGEITGFGTLMQMISPRKFLGKRIRFAAWIKCKEIKSWAGLWMRVDGPDNETLAFDNMQTRPIAGTKDWAKYEIVLDVSEEAVAISFGVLLAGTGQLWIDSMTWEQVPKSIPTTSGYSESELRDQPANMAFEK